jgi:hypothetical protein
MSTDTTHSKGGRPPNSCGPKVPYDEVDRLLVEGELVEGPGGVEVRVWPTQRDVAKRYDVSPSLIGTYAKQMNAQARREAFQAGKPLPPRTLVDAPPAPEPAPSETSEEEVAEQSKRRGPGRPRKSEAPVISLEELDRLLVFGEVVQTPDGAATTRFPTYRELADRYGVAVSYVAAYVKSHNCLRRRENAKMRLTYRVEDKLIEKRAEAIAVGKDDVVRLIDEFLLSFEKALKEGRVRSDNPTDVNTFVRLKEFILGGADSRQEVHAALSLESIQQRYTRMLQDRCDDPALTGTVGGSASSARAPESIDSNGVAIPPIEAPCSVVFEGMFPPPSSDDSAGKLHEFEGLDPDEEDSA